VAGVRGSVGDHHPRFSTGLIFSTPPRTNL
jgi:hypothetical protein